MLSNEETLLGPGMAGPTPIAGQAGLAARSTASRPEGPGPGLFEAMLDEIGIGVLLASGDGIVLHANRTARRACQTASPWRIESGMLRSTDAGHMTDLRNALQLARQGRRSMVLHRHGGEDYTVGVVPVRDPRTGAPAALFLFGSQATQAALGLQFFCQTHRLTLAESAVLAALARGLTPRQVAENGGVGVTTVRSQISAIRQKTHMASLAHLMRTVDSLPPMAAAAMLDS